MGRPSFFLDISFAKLFPESGYRVITFFLFYACMLFLWKILKNWLQMDDSARFWICALYAVMPINDIRIALIVFPYTIGLFFFMAGMSHLSSSLFCGSLTLSRRISALLLFLLSFTLNSNLFFFSIVLLMILTKERSIKRMLHYCDFIALPIVFFAVKTVFFPAHGIYAGYNSITLAKLCKALLYILPADCYVLCSVANNLTRLLLRHYFWVELLFVVAGLATVYLYQRKTKASSSQQTAFSGKKLLLFAALGFVLLSAGLFPYLAADPSIVVRTSAVDGRDAMLAPFGAALIFYSVGTLILRPRFARYAFTTFVMAGMLYFNLMYLSYQQDYYRQLGFQYQLTQHQELADASNIVYLNDDEGFINIKTFYHLNGNAELAFGNTRRLIMAGSFDTLSPYMDLDKVISRPQYHMSEYDASHKRIDAVITYDFHATLADTLCLKFYEIGNSPHFSEKLRSYTSMETALDGSAEYDALLAEAGYENKE